MKPASFTNSPESVHIPVLLNETVDALRPQAGGRYLDGTVGMGGHSHALLERTNGEGLLCGLDRDTQALELARARLAPFGGHVHLFHTRYSRFAEALDSLGWDEIDGALIDIGVSSLQIDSAERGFSFHADGPLDMRMDASDNIDAWFIVNRWPQEKIERILRDYGEERHAARIAARIAERREEKEIETTLELVDVIKSAMPAAALREKQHPAKRSFQAIRIAVNDELNAVHALMDSAPDRLKPGGRLCVISFHSLEDRIVKNAIHSREDGCTCPREAPVCTCGFVKTLRSVTRKPITAGGEELELNPRSRSAKLRVAERV